MKRMDKSGTVFERKQTCFLTSYNPFRDEPPAIESQKCLKITDYPEEAGSRTIYRKYSNKTFMRKWGSCISCASLCVTSMNRS